MNQSHSADFLSLWHRWSWEPAFLCDFRRVILICAGSFVSHHRPSASDAMQVKECCAKWSFSSPMSRIWITPAHRKGWWILQEHLWANVRSGVVLPCHDQPIRSSDQHKTWRSYSFASVANEIIWLWYTRWKNYRSTFSLVYTRRFWIRSSEYNIPLTLPYS